MHGLVLFHEAFHAFGVADGVVYLALQGLETLFEEVHTEVVEQVFGLRAQLVDVVFALNTQFVSVLLSIVSSGGTLV